MKNAIRFLVLLALMAAQTVKAAEPEIYGALTDEGKTLTLYYDEFKDKHTVLEEWGKGTTSSLSMYKAQQLITQVVLDASMKEARPTNTACWFSNMSNLERIEHLDYLNTSEVENMNQMFAGGRKLLSLDVSHFNTSKVTDMGHMFRYCEKLSSLDVSSFNTSNVTSMRYMFDNCSNLTELDVSHFNTAKVTSMYGMFSFCSRLESIDVSSFNTSQVTDMTGMFADCASLRTLDLNNFDLTNTKYISAMFIRCTNLQRIYCANDWTQWSKESLAGSDMFGYCYNLIGENGTMYNYMQTYFEYAHPDEGSNPGYFTVAKKPLAPLLYAAVSDEGATVTFYYDNQYDTRPGYIPQWCVDDFRGGAFLCDEQTLALITKAVMDKSVIDARPKYTYGWFANMKNLKTIEHLDYLNTKDVRMMLHMFEGCASLTALDLSSFNTENTITMWGMFEGCSSLTGLDLSSFNTEKVEDMAAMFAGCENLTTLDIDHFDTRKVVGMGQMFSGCKKLSTLYLFPYYDNKFITSKVTDMDSIFAGCESLTTLDMTKFSTGNVVRISNMFRGCSSLKTLDLTGFDMGKVEELDNMFYDCTSLTTIKCNDSWTVSGDSVFYNCTSLVGGSGTEYHSSRISAASASPDRTFFPGYFTATVPLEELYGVYDDAEKTLTIYYDMNRVSRGGVSDWNNSYKYKYAENTKKVVFDESVKGALPTTTADMFLFFEELESIEHLDYLNTQKVTNMSFMFRDCGKLTEIDLSQFNTKEVISMQQMFYGCAKVKKLDVDRFQTSSVENMSGMFNGCTSLDTLLFDTSKWRVQDMSYMFANCTNLKMVEHINWWQTDNVTDMQSMFANCENLTSINLYAWETPRVTNFNNMFAGCSKLEWVNIRDFDLRKDASVTYMFQGCSSLARIHCNQDWSRFADNINMPIFEGCTSLVGARGTACDGTMAFDDIRYATPDLDGHPGYFTNDKEIYAVLNEGDTTLTFYYDSLRILQNGTTAWGKYNNSDKNPDNEKNNITKIIFDPSIRDARPGSTYEWFAGFSKLKSFEHLDYLNTSKVTDMRYMFSHCRELTSLDLSNFDTRKVENFDLMFLYCWSLTELDVSSFVTDKASYFSYMFYGCTELTTLHLDNFNMENARSVIHMFDGCESLTTIYCNKDWSTGKRLEYSTDMFKGCTALTGEQGSMVTGEQYDATYARPDGGIGNEGYFTHTEEVYAVLEPDNTTLTMYYDKQREERGGVTDWSKYNNYFSNPDHSTNHIEKIVLDETMQQARPVSTEEWFDSFCYLTEIEHLDFLNTSKVKNMYSMFNNCQRLREIDLSHFNTSNVTTMNWMFVNCDSLTEIDLNSFDMQSVETTWCMFNGCNYLSTIYCTNDWSVTAPNLTQSGLTFGECKSLAGENGTVYDPNYEDVTYARPDGGKDAPGYFATTPFVVTILSEHGTVTVAEKRINLNRVRGYTTLHLTAEPEDGYIFTSWENYDPETGLLVTSDTTVTAVFTAIEDLPVEYYALFKGKNTLTLRYDNLRQTLGKTCQMEDLTLEERNQITRIEIAPSVAQASIPTLYNYFSSMPNLEVVEGLQYINTSGISDVSFMFFNCAALKTIDLTGFDLSNVTSAAGMFMGCTNLTTITCKADYTSLAGSNSAGMFDGCTSLVGGNGTTYSPAHKDASYARPDRGTDAPGYFTHTGTYTVTATVTPEEAGKIYYNHDGGFAYGEEFSILLIPADGYELVEWRQDGTPLEQKTLTISGIVLNDIHIEAVMKKNNPTGLEDVQSDDVLCTKLLRNGILYILRNGKTYNANGQLLINN